MNSHSGHEAVEASNSSRHNGVVPDDASSPAPSIISLSEANNNSDFDADCWPPRFLEPGSSLSRTSIRNTLVYLGVSKFRASYEPRPWTDSDSIYIAERDPHTRLSHNLANGEEPTEEQLPHTKVFHLICADHHHQIYGHTPGTITMIKWVHDAAGKPNYDTDISAEYEFRGNERIMNYFYEVQRLEGGIGAETVQRRLHLYERVLASLEISSIADNLDGEIDDLIYVISSSSFPDLSLSRHHNVSSLFYEDTGLKAWFLLAVSLHLYHRLAESAQWSGTAGMNFFFGVPRKIAAYMQLAQTWIRHCKIPRPAIAGIMTGTKLLDNVATDPTRIGAIKNFARWIKWPYMANVHDLSYESLEILRHYPPGRGSFLETWLRGLIIDKHFSSVILLGVLLDLTELHTNCYIMSAFLRILLIHAEDESLQLGILVNGHSFWHTSCIIGKVIGPHPDVWQVEEWICGVPLPEHLVKHRVLRVNTRPTKHILEKYHIDAFELDSGPDGPSSHFYQVDEFQIPEIMFDSGEYVKFVSLNFDTFNDENHFSISQATVNFLVENHQVRVPLRHQVQFIQAYHCLNGPHPLHETYKYNTVRARDINEIDAWNHCTLNNDQGSHIPQECVPNMVLVIEACRPDEEILARAWCSNLGLSAIVGDISDDVCAACVIRQAYVAQVSVVILNCSRFSVQADDKEHLETEPQPSTSIPTEVLEDAFQNLTIPESNRGIADSAEYTSSGTQTEPIVSSEVLPATAATATIPAAEETAADDGRMIIDLSDHVRYGRGPIPRLQIVSDELESGGSSSSSLSVGGDGGEDGRGVSLAGHERHVQFSSRVTERSITPVAIVEDEEEEEEEVMAPRKRSTRRRRRRPRSTPEPERQAREEARSSTSSFFSSLFDGSGESVHAGWPARGRGRR